MLALISPFQNLIDSLPTVWTQLIDRPLAVAPITTEAIALSLVPARLALAAIERFTQPEPEATEPESKPIATPKAQLCLPPAKVRRYEAKETEQVVQRVLVTPAPAVQPDGETPNLHDFYTVPNASGCFKVSYHDEGHLVIRWKKTKRHGWEQTTHLISQHGCDCEQARKKPSSVCCHQKALKSFQLSEKTRLQKEEWERQDNEKTAKVKAELDAIAVQRAKNAEAKLSGLIRAEAQSGKRPQAIGLAPKLTESEQQSRALAEARTLIMECSFNRHTGEAFLTERYGKTELQEMGLDQLQDLIEHLSTNKRAIKKVNLCDNPAKAAGLTVGALCKGKKGGWQYRVKALKEDGFAIVQTLTGGFESTIPIDKLEAI